jgi:putative two-component system response regulator
MIKLLVVQERVLLRGVFKSLLLKEGIFEFDIVDSYKQAQELLNGKNYDYAVVSRTLEDAKKGEVIALLNKHNIAPIVYIDKLSEEFMDSFESSHIVDYVFKHRHDNAQYAITKIKQLQQNKKTTVLVVHKSIIYQRYLKHNLELHNFKVVMVDSGFEALQKLEVYQDIKLVIIDNELVNIAGLEEINGVELVKRIRQMKDGGVSILSIAQKSNSYLTSCFLNEGADDYIIEQFSRDELYVRIYQNLKTTL